MMIEKQLETNGSYEVTNLNYHDFRIVEFSFSEDRGLISLKDDRNISSTKFYIEEPIEYNVTNIFPGSIVGEVFFIELDAVASVPRLSGFATHVIGGRLHDKDITAFLRKVAQRGRHHLLQLCSVDGGQISVVAPRITGITVTN